MLGYYVDVAVGFVGNTWQLATVFIKESEINGENDDEIAQIEKLAEKQAIKSHVEGTMFGEAISFAKTLWISDPTEMDDEEDIS